MIPGPWAHGSRVVTGLLCRRKRADTFVILGFLRRTMSWGRGWQAAGQSGGRGKGREGRGGGRSEAWIAESWGSAGALGGGSWQQESWNAGSWGSGAGKAAGRQK